MLQNTDVVNLHEIDLPLTQICYPNPNDIEWYPQSEILAYYLYHGFLASCPAAHTPRRWSLHVCLLHAVSLGSQLFGSQWNLCRNLRGFRFRICSLSL